MLELTPNHRLFMLLCVAVCCCVLWCVAVCCRDARIDSKTLSVLCYSVLQCVAVCFCVLRCVAVRCGVLRCVVVCCGVLQCVEACCGVLQRVAEIPEVTPKHRLK